MIVGTSSDHCDFDHRLPLEVLPLLLRRTLSQMAIDWFWPLAADEYVSKASKTGRGRGVIRDGSQLQLDGGYLCTASLARMSNYVNDPNRTWCWCASRV